MLRLLAIWILFSLTWATTCSSQYWGRTSRISISRIRNWSQERRTAYVLWLGLIFRLTNRQYSLHASVPSFPRRKLSKLTTCLRSIRLHGEIWPSVTLAAMWTISCTFWLSYHGLTNNRQSQCSTLMKQAPIIYANAMSLIGNQRCYCQPKDQVGALRPISAEVRKFFSLNEAHRKTDHLKLVIELCVASSSLNEYVFIDLNLFLCLVKLDRIQRKPPHSNSAYEWRFSYRRSSMDTGLWSPTLVWTIDVPQLLF